MVSQLIYEVMYMLQIEELKLRSTRVMIMIYSPVAEQRLRLRVEDLQLL